MSRGIRWHNKILDKIGQEHVLGIEVVCCNPEAACCHDSADGVLIAATAIEDAALHLNLIRESQHLQPQNIGEKHASWRKYGGGDDNPEHT